jgi:hypothetical protein
MRVTNRVGALVAAAGRGPAAGPGALDDALPAEARRADGPHRPAWLAQSTATLPPKAANAMTPKKYDDVMVETTRRHKVFRLTTSCASQ